MREAFLEDIIANPDDDAPRRIYADWLLQQDDPSEQARGEFIIIQCDLADGIERYCSPELRRRQSELLETNRLAWEIPLWDILWDGNSFVGKPPWKWTWSRGFVSQIQLATADFLEHTEAIFWITPIEKVTLSDKEPYIADLPAPLFGWFDRPWRSDGQDADDVPSQLWNLLVLGEEKKGYYKWYTKIEVAKDDLSNACVRYGRSLSDPLSRPTVVDRAGSA